MKNYNSGQAALIIILITAVVVTITASTISRTVTDVRISSEGVEGSQALYAAEAGLEQGLEQLSFQFMDYTDPLCDDYPGTPCTITHADGTPSNAYYWYEFTNIPTSSATSFSRGSIDAGNTKTIWLNQYIAAEDPFDGAAGNSLYSGSFRLTFKWSDMTQNLLVETIRIYDLDSGAPVLISVDRELHTVTPGTPLITIDTSSAPYSNRLGLVRIHPINFDITDLTISNYTAFPVQGRIIDSRGVVRGSGEGSQSVVKRISAIKWRYEIPAYFDYVLYSAGRVTK
ncbi:MAG: hypothetical protein UU81_C0017G0024 [Microgenomates group bacterium GW2011_GWC1_41_8]|uniref:Type 4 fimbrial biogenesis protein PilX N-terminal domain-containing protein n=1 Tax=Candidatus Roizmanbacteria bacterium GW2011_GWB1_40_7 TaxID=1618482 RepID=A0A0G0T8V5_9BACT|nr:MAG: hypothetical protein UT85_C0003G0009 [Candidatus Levybacteria bacterium GW2011_GWA2_40_16]KKR71201.1 MAG: hypothetical protein UU14_C0033G0009 [Candidatus Roizmanbacteria bacterium GW2011_GWB1_40_7]KKS23852.1 MAG: hypothetical protein UU81_C0017G0024 [Microgenomates group bacterium GW2011_GWC1_41_8]OGK49837.1 MAG: hypothetical protein A3A55_01980 [Candidatus Roizmanbacteria bacterium RIFCSPLOWO2_01_FULL_40_14]